MALAIRSLPVLEGSTANEFVKKANRVVKHPQKIELQNQFKKARSILKNAQI